MFYPGEPEFKCSGESNQADTTNHLPGYNLFAAVCLLSTKSQPMSNLSTTLVRHGKTQREVLGRTERNLTSIQSAQHSNE